MVSNNSKDGKLPRTLSEALADLPAREAARRAETSRKLAEAEPKFTEISFEEGVILSHMLNGEYEEAAEKARKHGFDELAKDAATSLVNAHFRVGDFPSAARDAKRYGLGNHAANAALFWTYAEAKKGTREDYIRALGILKRYAKLATGSHRRNIDEVIAGMKERLAPSREKSALQSCGYIIISLSAVVSAWATTGFLFSNGCGSEAEYKIHEKAFTRENPAEPAPANYKPLREKLREEAFAYIELTMYSKKLVSGIPLKVTQMEVKALPNPRDFHVEADGRCTGGNSSALFSATLFGMDKNHKGVSREAAIFLRFVCSPEGWISSSDEWSIRKMGETGSLLQGKPGAAQPFSDKRFPHKKGIAVPKAPKHMHRKMRRSC
ncbi:hypothetical protein JW721_04445 [Candidatus Micrarchaeota archaeon]|nr:hypothetical protein [Candidatus Micrarchaeota archaeon]